MQGDDLLLAINTEGRYSGERSLSTQDEIRAHLNGSIKTAVDRTDGNDFAHVEAAVREGMYAEKSEVTRREQITEFIKFTGDLIKYVEGHKDLQGDAKVMEAVKYLRTTYGKDVFAPDKSHWRTHAEIPNKARTDLVNEFDIVSQTDIGKYMENRPGRVNTEEVTAFTENALAIANAVLEKYPRAAGTLHTFAAHASEGHSVEEQINAVAKTEETGDRLMAVRAALNARTFGLTAAVYITKVDNWNAKHPDTRHENQELGQERLLGYLEDPENKKRTTSEMAKLLGEPKVKRISPDIEKDAAIVAGDVLRELVDASSPEATAASSAIRLAIADAKDPDLRTGLQVFATGFRLAAERAGSSMVNAKTEMYNLMYRASAQALVGEVLTVARSQQEMAAATIDKLQFVTSIASDAAIPEYVPVFKLPNEKSPDEIFAGHLKELGRYYSDMHSERRLGATTEVYELMDSIYEDFEQIVKNPLQTVSRISMV